jgi:hypothetical protein
VRIERAIAAAEAQLKIRASLPSDLPPDGRIVRVAVVNEQPPTLDIEYLIGGHRVLLRQRPAQSDPQFPPEARDVALEGFAVKALARVDGSGRSTGTELYWTRDGFDYALLGTLPLPDLVRIARGVARPGAA